MASGIFNDNGQYNHTTRMSYPGTFPTEFQFQNTTTHPFSQVQFVPERIVEFSVSQDGLRIYKVQWQDTWIPENQLLQYQNILKSFWLKQNKPNDALITPGSDLHNLSSTDILSRNISKLTKGLSDAATKLQNTSNTNSLLGDHQSSIHIPNENATKQKKQNGSHTISSSIHNQYTVDSIQDAVSTNARSNHEEGAAVVKSSENELKKLITQSRAKMTSVDCDGIDIVNVKNKSASEEEIRDRAREILSTPQTTKRGPRDGTASQPQTCFFCLSVVCSRKELKRHNFAHHLHNFGHIECEVCQRRFFYEKNYKAHVLSHSDRRNFVCEVCGHTSKWKNDHRMHMKIHTEESNYRCDVCHKNFKVKYDLKTHCLNEHKNQTNTCNVCKQTLKNGNAVYIHSMRHSGTRDHVCDQCGSSFKKKNHLDIHRRIHLPSSSSILKIKCPACEEEFVKKAQFRKHIEIAHQELAAKYRYEHVCAICKKDFAYKCNLDEHMRTHTEQSSEEFNSRVRTKKKAEAMSEEDIAKLSDKIERITDTETGEVKIRCKLCENREFRLMRSLENHLDDHKNGTVDIKSKCHVCHVCNKSFQRPYRLLQHRRKYHQEVDETKPIQRDKHKRKQPAPMKCNITKKRIDERKASLTAKSKLQIQIEESSSDDEDFKMDGVEDEEEEEEDYSPEEHS